jgi:phosphoribosyl-ATP pyrophosphohydrolase/phosphoribosyl-AMP cyclohydrolase
MNKFELQSINWEKVDGLVPAIIQDNSTHQVLMMGYMNHEALATTFETGFVTFYSRTQQRLWMKGETSNHVLEVVRILLDCDNDTLLIKVNIQGHCCHLNQSSCFGTENELSDVLTQLEQTIASRYHNRPAGHYTTQLFERGISRIAQKVGEEGVEVALAAVAGKREEIIDEAADLIYHLLVLLVAKQITFKEILLMIQKRKK